MQQQSSGGGATLTASTNGSEENAAEGHLNVGIVHHNDGVVATEFEDGATEAAVDGLADSATDGGRASEGDQVQALVLSQQFTNATTVTRNSAVNTVGNVESIKDALNDLGDGQRAQAGRRGALPDLAVAANERNSHVPAEDSHGEVEGGDDSDHAERVPHFHNQVVGTY